MRSGLVALIALTLLPLGCRRSEQTADIPIELTPTTVRAARRAYEGAPPVVPHPPLGTRCTACHTATGQPVPPLGMAPANPHSKTIDGGRFTNCRQCHLFAKSEEEFQPNDFQGLPQVVARADRPYPGAPPVIPHPLFMREDCLACHAGPAARPEIRCDHTQRANCRQCHVARHAAAAGRIAK